MKKVIITVTLIVLVLSLGIYFYSLDPNIIDEDYVSSKNFKSLGKRIEQEKLQKQKEEFVLYHVVKHILKNTEQQLALPYSLDSFSLQIFLESKQKIDIKSTELSKSRFGNYDFFAIGTLQKEHLILVLFLMKRPTVYKDVEIVIASIKDSTITDIKSIATFKKNISEQILSSLTITKDLLIKNEVFKMRHYPFKQENIINYSYTVLSDGTIEVNTGNYD